MKSQLATHATGSSETRQRFQGRWAATANTHMHRSLEIVKNERLSGRFPSAAPGILAVEGIKDFCMTASVFYVLICMGDIIMTSLKVVSYLDSDWGQKWPPKVYIERNFLSP